MIHRLVSSQLSSNASALVGVSLITVVISVFPWGTNDPFFEVVILPLYAIVGLSISIGARRGREKTARLFAQLPASDMQVSLAGLLFISLVALIPTVNLLIHSIVRSDWPVYSAIGYLASLYLSAFLFLTAIAIVMRPTNVSRFVLRAWKWVPLIGVLIFSVIFVLSGDNSVWLFRDPAQPALDEFQPNWALLIPILGAMVVTFGLIDVWVQQHADDHLG